MHLIKYSDEQTGISNIIVTSPAQLRKGALLVLCFCLALGAFEIPLLTRSLVRHLIDVWRHCLSGGKHHGVQEPRRLNNLKTDPTEVKLNELETVRPHEGGHPYLARP